MSSFSSYVHCSLHICCKISSLRRRIMVLYTHMPGVSERSRSGMERLGRGLPVFGHVLDVVAVVGSEEDDMAMVVGVG